MKKLYKLIALSFAGPFVATFFICLFILLMQFLWKYVDDLVGKGLEWYIIAELLFYASASLVPMALPLAVLLSSIMTFGTLAENYELAAFKSAGVSLQRIMQPLMGIILIIAALALYFSNNIIPTSNLKFASLLWDVRQQKPALDIKPGIFYSGIEGYSIRVGKKHEDGKTIEQVMVYNHTSRRGNVEVTLAREGVMWTTEDKRWLVVFLRDGIRYEEMLEKDRRNISYPHNRIKFSNYEMRFDLSAFTLTRTNEDLFRDNYQMLNLKQLKHYRDSTGIVEQNKRKRVKEYVKPYFFPLKDTSDRRPSIEERKLQVRQQNLAKEEAEPQQEALPEDPAERGGGLLKLGPERLRKVARRQDSLRKMRHVEEEAQRAEVASKEPVVMDSAFFAGVFANPDRATTNRAINFARTVRGIMETHSLDIEHYNRQIIRYRIEYHRKFILSFACIVLFFVGAPLGAIIRKGGIGMPSVVSVLIFILFYVISITFEKFAKQLIVSPFIGMWMPVFIIFPVGVFLTYKANKDSIIFTKETYLHFFRSLNIFRKKKTA
ncbi:MAG: LptF/LptG family permease [Bacteroidia bacterium]